MYADGRFARHPHFCYFALNTEMRWLALQADWICVRQHHMMPSSFSSIVLTWLLFISTIVTSITSTETQRACSIRLAPPMPCIRLVGASQSEPHTNGTSAARVCYTSKRSRGSKFATCGCARRPRICGSIRCRHARRRRPANSHVCTSACWLLIIRFCYEHAGSSQNSDERLRRRRERERTRRAGETAEQIPPALLTIY